LYAKVRGIAEKQLGPLREELKRLVGNRSDLEDADSEISLDKDVSQQERDHRLAVQKIQAS
jgi:hypothetical protein